MRSNLNRPHSNMPSRLGFKLWFAFCGTMVLCTMAGAAYLAITVATDPASLGRFVGSAMQGYAEKRP